MMNSQLLVPFRQTRKTPRIMYYKGVHYNPLFIKFDLIKTYLRSVKIEARLH